MKKLLLSLVLTLGMMNMQYVSASQPQESGSALFNFNYDQWKAAGLVTFLVMTGLIAGYKVGSSSKENKKNTSNDKKYNFYLQGWSDCEFYQENKDEINLDKKKLEKFNAIISRYNSFINIKNNLEFAGEGSVTLLEQKS